MRVARLGVLAVVLGWSTIVHAWPIAPAPLETLVETSDLIVLARVERIEKVPAPSDPREFLIDDSIAVLVVEETWKGSPEDTVQVLFSATMTCPAPAKYIVGEKVLAFLSATQNGWETTSLSYGSLYPEPDEIETFRSRVNEAISLHAKGASAAEKRAFHVRAAASRATRWHGLYQLAPGSDSLHSFYDRSAQPRHEKLSKAETALLAAGFVREPTTDRTLVMMLSLLREHRSLVRRRFGASAEIHPTDSS